MASWQSANYPIYEQAACQIRATRRLQQILHHRSPASLARLLHHHSPASLSGTCISAPLPACLAGSKVLLVERVAHFVPFSRPIAAAGGDRAGMFFTRDKLAGVYSAVAPFARSLQNERATAR